MSPRITGAVAARVLAQIVADRRTLALLLVVPPLLVTLLRFVLDGQPATFDRAGAALVGIFPFTTMFLVTSITMLRERTTGTLERLMTLPLSKLDLLLGYGAAFGLLATAQATLTATVALALLGLDVQGSALLVVGIAVLNALLGMALGLLVSAFAATEFQAVQFMPAFVLPQFLLCGLIVARASMAGWLQAVADAMPLTYAYDALTGAAAQGADDPGLAADAAVVAGAALLALVLAAATLRRRTP